MSYTIKLYMYLNNWITFTKYGLWYDYVGRMIFCVGLSYQSILSSY